MLNPIAFAAQKKLEEGLGITKRVLPYQEWVQGCVIRSESQFKKFQLFPWQQELHDLFQAYSKICIFKVRQVGATEWLGSEIKYQCLANPGTSAAVFSIGDRESKKVQSRVKQLDQSVSWVTDNKSELEFENGSRIAFLPTTDKGARSLESVTTILIDEAGFNSKIENLYSASVASQAMAGKNAKLFIVSTMPPEGRLSWFWQTFASDCPSDVDIEKRIQALQNGDTEHGWDYWVDDAGWLKVLIHWRAHPIFSQKENYLEETKVTLKLTEEALQREYNLSVPDNGASLFNLKAVQDCARGKWLDFPEPDRFYILGVDPNFGGNDYFVGVVIDITDGTYRLVAEYARNNSSIDSSMAGVVHLIDLFVPAVVAIENNSGGAVVKENLMKLRPHARVESFTTTRPSKLLITDRLAILVEQGRFIFPADWVGVGEFQNFSAAKREAVAGHDDRVMATAIALAFADQGLPATVGSGRVYF